ELLLALLDFLGGVVDGLLQARQPVATLLVALVELAADVGQLLARGVDLQPLTFELRRLPVVVGLALGQLALLDGDRPLPVEQGRWGHDLAQPFAFGAGAVGLFPEFAAFVFDLVTAVGPCLSVLVELLGQAREVRLLLPLFFLLAMLGLLMG